VQTTKGFPLFLNLDLSITMSDVILERDSTTKIARKAKPPKTKGLLELRQTILLRLSVVFEYVQQHPARAVEVSPQIDTFLQELEKTWYENDSAELEHLCQQAEALLSNTVMAGKVHDNW
jgi:hypothetical protein